MLLVPAPFPIKYTKDVIILKSRNVVVEFSLIYFLNMELKQGQEEIILTAIALRKIKQTNIILRIEVKFKNTVAKNI